MPLGAARITLLAKAATVTAVAEVIRLPKIIKTFGNAKISTAQSKFGGASALFDGTGDYLQVSPVDFLLTEDFTIEFWVRLNTKADQLFATFYNGSTYVGHLSFESNNNYGFLTYIAVSGGGVLDAAAGGLNYTATNTGQWYHIALTRQTNTFRFFVDGVLREGYTNTPNLTITKFFIGAQDGGNASTNGYIDEFRISNTARYTANFTAPTAPFVNDENTKLLLHMDGSYNGFVTAYDDNGVRAKNSIIAIGNAKLSTAQSKFGGSSYQGDGTGDYLTVREASNFNFGSSDFTIECWMRFNNFASIRVPIASRGGAGIGYGDWWCELGTNGKIYWGFKNQAGTQYYANLTQAESAFSTGVWYHIALVRNGTGVTYYRDGVATGGATTVTGSFGGNDFVYVGALGPGGYSLDGYIDEVRISNTARYTSNFTPPTAPFVNDSNTLLLLHMDGTNNYPYRIEDDNGVMPARIPNHVSYYGNAQIDTAQSKFGGASALFDDVGDYLEIKNVSAGNFSGDFTVECWIYTSDVEGEFLACFKHASAQGWGFITRSSNRLVWTSTTDGSTVSALVSSNNAFTNNTWCHVAVCHTNSTGLTEMFANGVRVASRTEQNPITVDSNGYIRIGGYIYGISSGYYTDGPRYYNGWLDDIRFSNVVRYSGSTYNVPTGPFQNDENTTLLLHMDGLDASTTFVDDVGQRTKKGISAIGVTSDTTQYKFDGVSYYFSGTSQKLVSKYNAGENTDLTLSGNYWTVEYWIRINAFSGQYTNVVGIWDETTVDGSTYYFSNNMYDTSHKQGFQYIYTTNGTNRSNSGPIQFGSALPTGTWIHQAFVRNGNTLTAYKDGVSVGTHDMTGRTIAPWNATYKDFTIGGMNSAGYLNGWLDEIRISNVARYTANFTAPTQRFQNDDNTVLLIHATGYNGDVANASDDNGVTPNWNYGA